MGLLPPESPFPFDRARIEVIAEIRDKELDQIRKRPRYTLPRDRIGIIVMIGIVLVIAALVAYVLLTGGFGNPPPPRMPQ